MFAVPLLVAFVFVALHMYVYVHTCTHNNSSGKGTKKIPYMQKYMGKTFKNVDFATKIEVLRVYATKKDEKNH